MIQELKMQNFKSFAAQRGAIRFGGLSLIIGTNASGKSNIRDGLRFIHGISRGYSIAEIIGEKYVEGGVLQWKGIRGGVKETVLRDGNPSNSKFTIEVNTKLPDDEAGAVATYSISVDIPALWQVVPSSRAGELHGSGWFENAAAFLESELEPHQEPLSRRHWKTHREADPMTRSLCRNTF
jgi:hypothetical protein